MHGGGGEGPAGEGGPARGRETWDDLRYVLAVAETGSVGAAARALGVNHATVLRRVSAFEERHGAPVFDRTARGYAVRPDRLAVIEAARAAGRAVDEAARLLSGGPGAVPALRVTSTDTFTHHVLPPLVARLAAAEGVPVELAASNAPVDLGRLGADLTVRPALRLPGDLVGETAGHLGFAAYAAPGAEGAAWLRLGGALARSHPAGWLGAEADAGRAVLSGSGADSFPVLAALAAAGAGRAVLPCLVGDAHPGLVRLAGAMPPLTVPIWVARHADLEGAGRLARLGTRLAALLREEGPRLSGGLPSG